MRRAWWLLIGVALSLAISRVQAQSAPTAQQAGLIVRFEDGRIGAYCVALDASTRSGLDMLERAGLAVVTQVGGVGSAVCRIDAVGCPADDCFCACRGGPECAYWSYWHLQADGWHYAVAGADRYQVTPGSVDGWSWGRGAQGQAPPPPAMSLTEICAAGPTTLTPSPVADGPSLIAYMAFGAIGVALLVFIGRWRSR